MGTHFFSPANVMPLLENVRGAKTSPQTIATCMAWGKALGKLPILVGNCRGFVGNRLLYVYSAAASECVLDGAYPEDVDAAIVAFGFKMGPFAMADLVGLDLGIQAWKAAGTYRPDAVPHHALIAMGRKGQKTKSGWFDYPDGRRGAPSPTVEALLRKMFPLAGKVPPTQEARTNGCNRLLAWCR